MVYAVLSELDAGGSQMKKTVLAPQKIEFSAYCSTLPALWLGLPQTLISTEKSLSHVQQELCRLRTRTSLFLLPPPLTPKPFLPFLWDYLDSLLTPSTSV